MIRYLLAIPLIVNLSAMPLSDRFIHPVNRFIAPTSHLSPSALPVAFSLRKGGPSPGGSSSGYPAYVGALPVIIGN
jgi:hypothetical protein